MACNYKIIKKIQEKAKTFGGFVAKNFERIFENIKKEKNLRIIDISNFIKNLTSTKSFIDLLNTIKIILHR